MALRSGSCLRGSTHACGPAQLPCCPGLTLAGCPGSVIASAPPRPGQQGPAPWRLPQGLGDAGFGDQKVTLCHCILNRGFTRPLAVAVQPHAAGWGGGPKLPLHPRPQGYSVCAASVKTPSLTSGLLGGHRCKGRSVASKVADVAGGYPAGPAVSYRSLGPQVPFLGLFPPSLLGQHKSCNLRPLHASCAESGCWCWSPAHS